MSLQEARTLVALTLLRVQWSIASRSHAVATMISKLRCILTTRMLPNTLRHRVKLQGGTRHVPVQIFAIILVHVVNTIVSVAELHLVLLHVPVFDLNAIIGGLNAIFLLLMYRSMAPL